MDPLSQLSDDEAWSFLHALFPHGFAGDDVMAELAPEGWAQSPLVRAYHPTVEQTHIERLRWHERSLSWDRLFGKQAEAHDPPPTFAETTAEFEETPIEAGASAATSSAPPCGRSSPVKTACSRQMVGRCI